jgi:death-on-curing protein
MSEPNWVGRDALALLHSEAIAAHGGMEGIGDEMALAAALAQPKFLFASEGVSDLARLAACYALGLAKNRPFVSGNAITAFIALGLFLRLNAMRLAASQTQACLIMQELNGLGETELTGWIRKNARPA